MPKTDRHSRIVGWLKVALPLAALALLSTLFLLADRIDPAAAIRYTDVDVEALVRDPRMTAPTYAGTTSDGAALTMTAEAARPAGRANSAGAEKIALELEMPGGGNAQITSNRAEIDTGAGEIRLTGAVGIATSSGYEITTEALTALLDRSGIFSPSATKASGPQVTIASGSFRLGLGESGEEATKNTGAGPTPYLLVFSQGVQMLYQPEKTPAPDALRSPAPAETVLP